MDIANIITEANYWAEADNSDFAMGEHVSKAFEQRKYRSSLTEDRLQELNKEGTILPQAVTPTGRSPDCRSCRWSPTPPEKPSRITSRVSLGRGQVVNVKRETHTSGKIHDKGFMILTDYLHGKYGHDKPLILSDSIDLKPPAR